VDDGENYGEWRVEDAKITRRNSIEVWSGTIAQPKAVRYALTPNLANPNRTNARPNTTGFSVDSGANL